MLDPFWKLRSLEKQDNGMDINREDVTTNTTHYQVAYMTYVENEFCARHWHLPIIKPECVLSNNCFSSAIASRSGQLSYDSYDLSSDDKQYLMPNELAGRTPGPSNHAAGWWTPSSSYLNSLPVFPQNRGQIDPNHNGYHHDPRELSNTFWIPDITDWWCQHE